MAKTPKRRTRSESDWTRTIEKLEKPFLDEIEKDLREDEIEKDLRENPPRQG